MPNWAAGLRAAGQGVGQYIGYEMENRRMAADQAYRQQLMQLQQEQLDWRKKEAVAAREHASEEAGLSRDLQLKLAKEQTRATEAWRDLQLSTQNVRGHNEMKMKIMENMNEVRNNLQEHFNSVEGGQLTEEQQSKIMKDSLAPYRVQMMVLENTEPGGTIQLNDESISKIVQSQLPEHQREAYRKQIEAGIPAHDALQNASMTPHPDVAEAMAAEKPPPEDEGGGLFSLGGPGELEGPAKWGGYAAEKVQDWSHQRGFEQGKAGMSPTAGVPFPGTEQAMQAGMGLGGRVAEGMGSNNAMPAGPGPQPGMPQGGPGERSAQAATQAAGMPQPFDPGPQAPPQQAGPQQTPRPEPASGVAQQLDRLADQLQAARGSPQVAEQIKQQLAAMGIQRPKDLEAKARGLDPSTIQLLRSLLE